MILTVGTNNKRFTKDGTVYRGSITLTRSIVDECLELMRNELNKLPINTEKFYLQDNIDALMENRKEIFLTLTGTKYLLQAIKKLGYTYRNVNINQFNVFVKII